MNIIIEIIRASLPATVPILLAALGGAFTWHADVFNISMEGMLLGSAFTAVVGSYFFESWIIGILFGILGSLVISLVFGFFVLKLNTGEFITGIAINTFMLGATTYFLRILFNVKGTFTSPRIVGIPKINFDWLGDIPVLGPILNNQSYLVYLTFLFIVPLTSFVLFKTKYGLRLRAVGQSAKVVESLGIKSDKIKLRSILIAGLLNGIGGSFLSLGYMNMYTENMSNGRGWISLAVIIVSSGKPVLIMLIAVLFGIMEGMGLTLQLFNIPSQITSMLPYITVLVALFLNSRAKNNKGNVEETMDDQMIEI